MSFFDYDRDNKISLRLDKIKFNDAYIFNENTGEYDKLVNAGGDEPVVLPYYLKNNSVKVENESKSSNTLIDENSVDVVDVTGNKSSSLLSDKLILGDTNGNVELTKDTIGIGNKLNQATIDAVISSTASNYKPISWDSTNNRFKRMDALKFGINPSIGIQSDQVLMTNSLLYSILKANSLVLKSEIQQFSVSSDEMKLWNQSSPFQTLNCSNSELKIGSTTNSVATAFDTTKNHIKLKNNEISLFDESTATTSALNIDSFKTLNSIKNASSLLPTSDTKMLLYNSTSKNYNYYNIHSQWRAANDFYQRTPGDANSSLNRVLMHEEGTGDISYVNLNDTFTAANKIRDMTSGTIDTNKKMMMFDTSDNTVKYTDIPGSVSVPSYIYNDKIEMASSGNGYIKTQNPSGSSSASITKVGVLELTNAAGQRNDLDSLGVKWVNDNKNNTKKDNNFYIFYEKLPHTDVNKTTRLGFWDNSTVTEDVNPNTFVINDADLGATYQEMKYTDEMITLDLKFIADSSGFKNQSSKFIMLENNSLVTTGDNVGGLITDPFSAYADQIFDVNYTPRNNDTHGIMPTFTVTLCQMKINHSPTSLFKKAIKVECNTPLITGGATASTEFKGYLSFRIVKRSKMNIDLKNSITY